MNDSKMRRNRAGDLSRSCVCALLAALLLPTATAWADVRIIEYTYLDDTNKWVLGQIASEREATTGVMISQDLLDQMVISSRCRDQPHI